jgi:hypothetical protein
LGILHKKPFDKILKAMSYGFCFNAPDESGVSSGNDLSFLKQISEDFENTVIDKLGFDPEKDRAVINGLKLQYESFNAN